MKNQHKHWWSSKSKLKFKKTCTRIVQLVFKEDLINTIL